VEEGFILCNQDHDNGGPDATYALEERFGTEWDIPWDFHPNLLPILHHFNDNLNTARLPDFDRTDPVFLSRSQGGESASYLVFPLLLPNPW
jgi:hypothetical protein